MTEYRTARPESLEQVFLCYTKDNLQDIAKKHGLKGFSKWNKKDLAKWLRDQLLNEAVMGEIVKQASADETRFFESAIQEQGILISQELVADSLLLTTYGAYDPKQELYLVPEDVETTYEKICTPDMQAEKADRNRLEDYAKSAGDLRNLSYRYQRCRRSKSPVGRAGPEIRCCPAEKWFSDGC